MWTIVLPLLGFLGCVPRMVLRARPLSLLSSDSVGQEKGGATRNVTQCTIDTVYHPKCHHISANVMGKLASKLLSTSVHEHVYLPINLAISSIHLL